MAHSQLSLHEFLAPPEAVAETAPALVAYLAAKERHRKDWKNARARQRRANMSAEKRAALKEKRKARDAARYERDRLKIISGAKKYYRKKRHVVLSRDRKRRQSAGYVRLRMLRNAAKRAAKNGLEFNLDFTDVHVPDRCPVLGIPLRAGSAHGNAARACNPSLDRIDNSKGYIKGNVRVISLRANWIKRDSTVAELEAVIAYMRGLR